MPTTYVPKKIYDIRRWEPLGKIGPGLVAGSVGRNFCSIDHVQQLGFAVMGGTLAMLYRPENDGWGYVTSSPGNFFGNGSCSVGTTWSTGATTAAASLTATAGTTSTITTNQTLIRNLAGWPIHIMSGPNAGLTLTISSNTIGSNSVITVPTQSSAFNNTTTYRLMTPKFFSMQGSTSGRNFYSYDYATNAWQTLSTTGLPSTISDTEGMLVTTPSWAGSEYVSFSTSQNSGISLSTTLKDDSKNWTANQWTNYQVRIVSGQGAGQIRTISSNTIDALTVSSPWTTIPNNSSTYSIEGNDNFVYYLGNGAVTLYRYSISANTWTTLSPSVARGGATSNGAGAVWVSEVPDSTWTNESSIINGRRIYSTRAGATADIDYYDIPANTWVSVDYGTNRVTSFTGSGCTIAVYKQYIYLSQGSTNYNAWHRFNLITNELEPFLSSPLTAAVSSSTVLGNKSFIIRYKDGNTVIPYLHHFPHTTTNSPPLRIKID